MTYTVPFRLRILTALTDALREITPANGYVNDFSGTGKDSKVFRGRAVFGEGDPLPMLSILEPPLPADRFTPPDMAPAVAGPWDLVIQGFVQDDKSNPTDPAHIVSSDVLRRLALEKKKEGSAPYCLGFRRIRRLIIGPPVVRPPDDMISARAYCWVGISIDMAEDMTQPYED